MELTVQEVREKEKELKDIEEELKIALAQQQEAKSLGDFSENSELDIATTKVRELQARKVVLLEQLSDYTVVKPNKSRRIVLGDYVELVKLDNNNQPISEARKMRLAREGNTLQSKLGLESPLGKAILNGTDGIYNIGAPIGVIRYHVKKVIS